MSLLRHQSLSVIILITITSITTTLPQQQKFCDYQTFPFTVTLNLRSTSQSFCSGSLLAPKWVLTAAHCTHILSAKRIFVRTPTASKQYCHKIYVHPSFDEKTIENDISLILLSGKLGSENYATLPSLGFTNSKQCQMLDALGWEHNHIGFKDWRNMNLFCARDILRFDSRNKLCMLLIPAPYLSPDKVVCASSDLLGFHPCPGDSGGPLVCNASVVVGIVSFGAHCPFPYAPTIYTKVEEFREFLVEVLLENNAELNEMRMGINSSVYYVTGSGEKLQASWLWFFLFVLLVTGFSNAFFFIFEWFLRN